MASQLCEMHYGLLIVEILVGYDKPSCKFSTSPCFVESPPITEPRTRPGLSEDAASANSEQTGAWSPSANITAEGRKHQRISALRGARTPRAF